MKRLSWASPVALTGAIGALAVAVTLVGAAPAVAGPLRPGAPIHPNQIFGALVNGRNGVSAPVVIEMACFGPIRPGQTGHPLKGQTVSVFLSTSVAGPYGNTGANGHEIGAFFGPPPPASAAGGPVIFKRYGTKAIPTSEVLPCSGTGDVTFVPLPMSPGTSEDVVVPVVFVGQP